MMVSSLRNRCILVSSLRNRCIFPSFQQNAWYSTEKSVAESIPRLGNQNKRNTSILLKFLKLIFFIYMYHSEDYIFCS